MINLNELRASLAAQNTAALANQQNSFIPGRQRTATRVSKLGRIGSPAQENIFQQQQQGEDQATASLLAALGQQNTGTVLDYSRLNEQEREFNESRDLQIKLADEARKRGKRSALLKGALGVGGGILGSFAGPAGNYAGSVALSGIGSALGEALGSY